MQNASVFSWFGPFKTFGRQRGPAPHSVAPPFQHFIPDKQDWKYTARDLCSLTCSHGAVTWAAVVPATATKSAESSCLQTTAHFCFP